jgi:histidine ammonia-lyase
MTVEVDGFSLTLADVVRVARERERVSLAPEGIERMKQARAVVEEILTKGEAVYGLTTGVGSRKRVAVSAESVDRFNRLVLLNSRVGQGPAATEDVVRAAMLLLANGLSKGTTGVRPELARRITEALNADVYPQVRILGSVGLADLAPMADLAHGLFPDPDYRLASGEGLALLSNNAFSTGMAALAFADCERLVDALDVAGALDLEAFASNLSVLHLLVSETRPFPGIRTALDRLREALKGSWLWDEGASRNLQDPLSFRCLPQVHGAGRDALEFTRGQLEIELNASQGNPVVDLDERRVISVANFDALPIAASLDFLRIALAPILTCANERLVKLLQTSLSGLPVGLAARSELGEDALSELGVAGQALTAEARLLAQPVSFELASSTHEEGIEDRTTMASLAARRLAEMVELGEGIVAIELVVAAQAIDLRAPSRLGSGTRRVRDLVRERISFMGEGEPVPQDIEPIRELVRSGELS